MEEPADEQRNYKNEMSAINVRSVKAEFQDTVNDNIHQKRNHENLNKFVFEVFHITPRN